MSLLNFFKFSFFETKSFGQRLAEIAGVANQEIVDELQRDRAFNAGYSTSVDYPATEFNSVMSAIESSQAIETDMVELNNTCLNDDSFDHGNFEHDTFSFDHDTFSFGNDTFGLGND